MSLNTSGLLLRYTSWGESHGPAIGCVLDGVPPGIALTVDDIQKWVDRRRPGQNRYTSQRREDDRVSILSGVFQGQTTGMPIALVIENNDVRSKDYDNLKQSYRPGHADYTYQAKYGIRDYRGGGRASARETAMRVAAGAIARKILSGSVIRAALVQVGNDPIDRNHFDWDEVDRNPFFCPDPKAAKRWAKQVDQCRKQGSSIGAKVEIQAEGMAAGLGEPVYGRLDADIAGAMMGIPAVKGVEIGSGFSCVTMKGEDHNDPIRIENRQPRFLSNHAGGILGGISNGDTIVARIAIKPASSIPTPMASITTSGEETTVSTRGRHDPCLGIRAVPVAEAVLTLVLADHWLRAGKRPAIPPETPSASDPHRPNDNDTRNKQ